MRTYKIKEHEVPLFPIRYLSFIFNGSRSAVVQKEIRGILPPANFRNPANNNRLYSIEDLALIEYIHKEIFPFRQGAKTPEWVKELAKKALDTSRRIVVQYGSSQSSDDWKEIARGYTQFDRFRAQLYIDSWRRRLLDVNKFFPELVDEDDE
jgi:hypothetical protein